MPLKIGMRPGCLVRHRRLNDGGEPVTPLGDDVGGDLVLHIENLLPVRRLVDGFNQSEQGAIERRHHSLAKSAVFGQSLPRTLERLLENTRADGAKNIGLVAELKVQRGPGDLGRAGNVVHRGPREAIGEEHLHGAIKDTLPLRIIGTSGDQIHCTHFLSMTIDKITDFVNMSQPSRNMRAEAAFIRPHSGSRPTFVDVRSNSPLAFVKPARAI